MFSERSIKINASLVQAVVLVFYLALSYPIYVLSGVLSPQTFTQTDFIASLTSSSTLWVLSITAVIVVIYAINPFDVKGKKANIDYKKWVVIVGKQPLVMPVLTVITLGIGIWASVSSTSILSWVQVEEKPLYTLEEISSLQRENPNKSLNEILEQTSASAVNVPPGTRLAIFLLLMSFYGFYLHYRAVNVKEKEKDSIDKERNKALATLIELAPASNFHELLGNYVDIIEDFAFDQFSAYFKVAEQLSQSLELANKQLEENIESLETSEGGETEGDSIDIGEPDPEKAKKVEEAQTEIRNIESKIEKLLEEQQDYIRAVLYAMGRLAAAFEQATISLNSTQQYRVNLMLKHPPEGFEGLTETQYRYFPSIPNSPSYILSMQNHYAVLIGSDSINLLDENGVLNQFPSDTTQRNCIMPVFVFEDEDEAADGSISQEVMTHYNMFGAPTSILTGEPRYVPDTVAEVTKWRAKGGLTELADEADVYFRGNAKARSLISIPLSTSRYNQGDLDPENMIAALNIIRNKPGMLNNERKADQFFHITRPIIISLSRMLNAHIQLLEIPIKGE